MPTITQGDKILVSGANGYLAMWVVRTFLERGYAVRGTVRSESKIRTGVLPRARLRRKVRGGDCRGDYEGPDFVIVLCSLVNI